MISLAGRLRARGAAWMRRRQGEDALPVTLERRRLYILPTRAGTGFGALLLLMLLAGLNYANSLALFVTFLLTAFALVAMQACHGNLLGAQVLSATAPAVFAGTTGRVLLTLGGADGRARLQLEAALPQGTPQVGDLAAHGRQRLELPLEATARGRLRIERIRLATIHPFGLFRAWTWIHTPLEILVYPRAYGSLAMPTQNAPQAARRSLSGAGDDEWTGLRAFRDGDSPRQVDWKAYAREAPLLVKDYSAAGAELRLFEYARLTDPDAEARLSQLARWVVDAEARGERYGLILPEAQIAPDRGPEHRHRCLAALALFGHGDGASLVPGQSRQA